MSQRYFTPAEWSALPLAFRQRWWLETDYGRKPPSEALLPEARAMVEKQQETVRAQSLP